MTKTELIKRAKEILSEAYEEAAYMVAEFVEKHPRIQLKPLCREIDPENWQALDSRVRRARSKKAALEADSGAAGPPEWIKSRNRKARQVARERPEELVAELPDPAVEKLAKAATDTLVERSRAKRKEHDTTPTAGDLMGEDKFDPAEYWADTLVIRVNRNARELASLVKRAGGLLYGSMTPEEAFEYLHEAEGLIAEARAAAQEQSHDRLEVS